MKRNSSQFERVEAAVTGDMSKLKGRYRVKRDVKRFRQQESVKDSTRKRVKIIDLTTNKEIHIQHTLSDNSNDKKGFVSIKDLEAQFPPPPPPPPPRRRRGHPASNSSDEEVNEEISDEVDGDEADEGVNMEEGVEEVVEKVVQ
jgi:hypothetical protein